MNDEWNTRQMYWLNVLELLENVERIWTYKFPESGSKDVWGFVQCQCFRCNSWINIRYDHFLERLDERGKILLCSDCAHADGNIQAGMTRSGPGKCTVCGKAVSKRDAAGICLDCRSEKSKNERANNEKPGICKICGDWNERRNNVGLGIECGCSKKMYDERGMKLKFCKVCCKVTLHNESKCMICNPEAKAGKAYGTILKFCKTCNKETWHFGNRCKICDPWKSGPEPNFIIKANIRYYKNEPVEFVSAGILNGTRDIKYYPEFNIRFGHVFYKTTDILTGDIKKLNGSSFKEYNNVLMYLDKSKCDYVPWDDFKKRFLVKPVENLPNGFVTISTFREQNSENWNGAIGAFEQYLVDMKIGWFVYIKFYIDLDNISKPLVVGKSGSLLVNSTGSDVCFSEDPNDGPARRFLIEKKVVWDKTKIAILACKDEQEAFLNEKELQQKLELFGS